MSDKQSDQSDSSASSLSIYTTMWNIQNKGVIMPLGGLLLLQLLEKTLVMRKTYLSFLALHRLTGQSYKGGVVQSWGYKILSRSESLDDESDRISFCQVFGDLVMFRIKVAPLNCPIFLCRIAVLIKNVLHKLLSVDYPQSVSILIMSTFGIENNAFENSPSINKRMQLRHSRNWDSLGCEISLWWLVLNIYACLGVFLTKYTGLQCWGALAGEIKQDPFKATASSVMYRKMRCIEILAQVNKSATATYEDTAA